MSAPDLAPVAASDHHAAADTVVAASKRFYVKTFDADGEFVREISVRAANAQDAVAAAAIELCSDEVFIERPMALTGAAVAP